LIADKSQNLIMFNFIKLLDTAKENQVPANRKYDPVVSIDVTKSKNKIEHQIISCSHDRDLRIWNKSDGVFVKKYDLSSFLADNVQCIKLGKNEENLFLGSKDMNVYLINISKGKLCVVYEGHWNRVTSIYSVPETDILITISESNIKIWDLEYDECIKNMNEHSSMIVYIEQLESDE
jgi:WD40 repeat protein